MSISGRAFLINHERNIQLCRRMWPAAGLLLNTTLSLQVSKCCRGAVLVCKVLQLRRSAIKTFCEEGSFCSRADLKLWLTAMLVCKISTPHNSKKSEHEKKTTGAVRLLGRKNNAPLALIFQQSAGKKQTYTGSSD